MNFHVSVLSNVTKTNIIMLSHQNCLIILCWNFASQVDVIEIQSQVDKHTNKGPKKKLVELVTAYYIGLCSYGTRENTPVYINVYVYMLIGYSHWLPFCVLSQKIYHCAFKIFVCFDFGSNILTLVSDPFAF